MSKQSAPLTLAKPLFSDNISGSQRPEYWRYSIAVKLLRNSLSELYPVYAADFFQSLSIAHGVV